MIKNHNFCYHYKLCLVGLIVLTVIVAVLVLFSKRIRKYFKCRNDIQIVQFALRNYIKDFDRICRDNNITYWADSGTLLGAVRDGGIIKHDDDIDVCVDEKDYEKLVEVLKNHPVYNITTADYIDRFMRRDVDSVYIDVFVTKNTNGIIRYSHKENIKRWPNMFYKQEELFPLKQIKFDEIEIPVPQDPVPYLKRSYGNWEKPVVWSRH
jgi:phosphorylcholine metabolism protein LicD